ncbi:phosphoribosylanthranilate isomerase [Candidatus Aerophobetes bacterium]|nr:phosphoribosylanthranilate isomerase [Candidatus Aerophobetes bacterium]
MVKIKICGITNKEDAFLAVNLGVDALGFIFAKSPRQIAPEEAKRIIKKLPPFVDRVGVFVNEEPQKVLQIARFCLLSTCQFHGDESPSYCEEFPYKLIKSFFVKDEVPDNILDYEGRVDACLLDTFSSAKRGGTGKVFNWEIARKVKMPGLPLILSGGLTPDNVAEAIDKVRPYAVDVASGVEDAPGKKSRNKLQKFIEIVRRAK